MSMIIAIQSCTKEQLHLHPRIELLHKGIKVASQGILQNLPQTKSGKSAWVSIPCRLQHT